MPSQWPVQNLSQKKKCFSSPSPAGSSKDGSDRHTDCKLWLFGFPRLTSKLVALGFQAVSASIALRHLYELGRFDLGSRAWLSTLFFSQNLYKQLSTGLSYLIIASSTYAVRAWRLHALGTEHFQIDTSVLWVWLVIAEPKDWTYIPTRCSRQFCSIPATHKVQISRALQPFQVGHHQPHDDEVRVYWFGTNGV